MTTTAQAQSSDPGNGQQLASRDEFISRLREETTAVRLRRAVFGNTKSLSAQQIEEIATKYSCDKKSVRAKKVLLNRTKLPRVKRCYQAVDAAIAYWKANTMPYSHAEKGIRLIRRSLVPQFEQRMTELVDELSEAVVDAQEHLEDEILPEARERLQELFDPADYPGSLLGQWKFDWEYPNVEPPEYLLQLNPELYHAEKTRIEARFSEALQAAEEVLAKEFGSMLQKLAERLTPSEDGKRKTFQYTRVTQLQEFFQRFQYLSVGSNAELERLVGEAKGLLEGKTSDELRKSAELRETIGEQVEAIYGQVAEFIVDRPDRQIDLEIAE